MVGGGCTGSRCWQATKGGRGTRQQAAEGGGGGGHDALAAPTYGRHGQNRPTRSSGGGDVGGGRVWSTEGRRRSRLLAAEGGGYGAGATRARLGSAQAHRAAAAMAITGGAPGNGDWSPEVRERRRKQL
ncbi:glycine-rich protein DOT1-like [Ananas comosus]|uniref:Glycine-rich protein DOT1-like n=1 Tax=Ananas comosus TaxID=4615 RepID=A0A6P5EYX7_ANACO|nr:glycine-rich protein DOT1-like [Ananas comosus]